MLAIHCAAAAGFDDMVYLLLEGDNMRDLNTCTYHTKESLAHLAVKNGRRNVYDLLVALGADMRNRDAYGKYVYDLTSDPNWKESIRSLAEEQRRQDGVVNAHRGREHEFERQRNVGSDRLRRGLEQQRDSERNSSLSTERRLERTLTSQAAPASAHSPSLTTTSKKSTKKKNKKKNKNKQENAAAGSKSVVTSQTSAQVNDTLASPLFVFGVEKDEEVREVEDPVERLMAVFTALKTQDGSIEDKEMSEAVRSIDRLAQVMTMFTAPERQHGLTQESRQREAQNALRAIHLMNKYHRQLPETPAVPRPQLWRAELKPDPSTLSPLENLQMRCETSTEWVRFVLDTALVFISCNRAPLARELLGVVEKRLLKLKQRPLLFRKWVEMYAKVRQAAGLDRLPSTPAGKEQLEWYLTTPVDDDQILLHLDQLHGCSAFFAGECVDPAPVVRQFAHTVTQIAPETMDYVFIGSRVVFGSDSQDAFLETGRFLFATAERCNCHMSTKSLELMTKSIKVFGFEFSSRGIIRVR